MISFVNSRIIRLYTNDISGYNKNKEMAILLSNIKVLREEKGVSQQKLADAIGMSQSSINDYENRGIEPDITTLIRMADFFETSVDFVVGHTNIRRKIEKVNDYALNEREAALIDGYRHIQDSERKVVEDMVAVMMKK
jgi:transcriptional regulator with XRE-family HTH domain